MTSTFEDYAERLEASRLAPGGAATSDVVATAIGELDEAVAAVEGHGFEPTPFAPAPGAGPRRPVSATPSCGSRTRRATCRARTRLGTCSAWPWPTGWEIPASGSRDVAPYAIASCGNAALAAAVVARAVGRPIDVFVPTWANEAVVDRITELGGRVVRCERRPGVPGDPAHHAMLAAIEAGAVPFSCQGTETPATIDGGRTLAWEMVDALIEHDGGAPARLDRLFVQVGGGALATAVVTGLAAAARQGRSGPRAGGPCRSARGQPSPGAGLGHAGA